MYKEITEFIKNLYGNIDFTPLHAPIFFGNEKKYVDECIDSTFVSSVGKFVDKFEEMIKDFTGAKKAICIVNGTNALQIAMKLSGIEENDEVITQPLTFVATCNAISYLGAHPVFVDVDKETLGMSPSSLQQFINSSTKIIDGILYNKTTGRKITGCVPMHTFGHSCKIDEIVEICNEYKIAVIEDAAESLGTYYKGIHTGRFGKFGIFSFNGNKTITTGGGGMIITDDEELGKRAKHITTTAKVPDRWAFFHDEIGYNYRLPNINAALGCAQMENINFFLDSKRKIANKYNIFLSKYKENLDFFNEPSNSISNYWLNSIIFKNKQLRDDFLNYTNDNGVMTRPIWNLMYKLPMYSNCSKIDTPNSEWIEEKLVNIPSGVIR